MQIIKKLWLLMVFIAFFLGAAFTAVGFLQAGFLSLPSTAPSLSAGDNIDVSTGLLNGYKGYRHHRTGFRRHDDGWWYPKAAFTNKAVEEKLPTAPTIVASPATQAKTEAKITIQESQETVNVVEIIEKPKSPPQKKKDREVKNKDKKDKSSAKHVKWCAKKYRSYRRSDNTFQPLKGRKRKICHSPY